MSKNKPKPYLETLARSKHPTIAVDAVAYQSGSKKSFETANIAYITSVEKIDLAIRSIANIISLCDMRLYKEDPRTKKLSPTSVNNLDFEYPNETDSSVDFLRKLAVNIFAQGAGLIVTEEGRRGKLTNSMINFYSLDVSRVTVESDGKSLISNFIYTSESGAELKYDASDCVYINDSINPSNLLYSLSRLKSLNDAIMMQAGIVNQAKVMLTGGAKDSCILSCDQPISPSNMETVKNTFNEFITNTASTSMFVNMPLNVDKVGNSMSGAEMLALLSEINDMLLAQFAIPPYLLGDYKSGANRNTEITYSNRIFFTMQLKPVLKNIEKQISRFMKESLGLRNVVMRFDYRDLDILMLSDEEKSDMVLKQLKGGLISLNEARQQTEYAPVDGEAADKVFMPSYLLGSAPVSYNAFDEDLSRMLQTREALPSGNAGGDDNTNVITDSRGGANEE